MDEAKRGKHKHHRADGKKLTDEYHKLRAKELELKSPYADQAKRKKKGLPEEEFGLKAAWLMLLDANDKDVPEGQVGPPQIVSKIVPKTNPQKSGKKREGDKHESISKFYDKPKALGKEKLKPIQEEKADSLSGSQSSKDS